MGWAQPIFFSADRLHHFGFTLKERVTRGATLGQLLEATIPPMGFELVDWELQPRARLVRVFIDKPEGVDVEDCARVSNHLTHLFTVENVDYERLEVSSPGLDRPLKKLDDFARFAGEEVLLHLHELTDGARRLKGRIKEVRRGPEGDEVILETDKGTRTIPIGAIDKARLVPKIDWRKGK